MDRVGGGPGETSAGGAIAAQMMPEAVHALFQQRIAGDDALLKLAGLRFAQMGVAAEVYADILDWPGNTWRYWRNRHASNIPLVQNLLRNHDYRQYYLDYMEYMLDTEFNPSAFAAQIGAESQGGLWDRVRQAAYLESDTPYGRPFTGRQFSNDEIYWNGCRQHGLRHGRKKMEGIVHYVRMRRDSARAQLKRLRQTMPRGVDGFPETAEQLRRAA